ncbi:MAG: hypothetical protein IPI67_29405 [Myxococcales bacterium]|nr:hypothetical protein [Myxococcales bacterium]
MSARPCRCIALGWATLVVALSCGRATPTCPAAYAPDDARTARILDLLAHDPEAAELARRQRGTFGSCFSPGGAGVTAGDLLLLDGNSGDARLAARVAHLLLHREQGRERTSGHAADPEEAPANALEARVHARLRQGDARGPLSTARQSGPARHNPE